MATAFQSLEQLSKPQTLDVSEIAPPAIAQPQRSTSAQQSAPAAAIDNPVIPKQLSTLATQGSNISTLGQILAWVAAAKGDFRGLQAIEENKRMTALGKSLHPRMLKINELTTSGKWEDASKEAESIVGEYGPVAREMMPYFTEMRNSIRTKQSEWQNLKNVHSVLARVVKSDNVNYPLVEALGEAVQKQTPLSASSLSELLTRGATTAQVISDRASFSNPLTQQVSTQMLPQAVQASRLDNFVGMQLMGEYGLTGPEQLASIMNDIPVQTSAGQVIQPGSAEALKVKQQYSALLPLQARIEAAKTLALDPQKTFQAIAESGFFNTLIRDFDKPAVGRIEDGVRQWLTMQEEARRQAQINVDPYQADAAGRVNIDSDPTSSTFLREIPPQTYLQVQRSGGKIAQPRAEVYDKQVIPTLYGLESLDLIPTMLQGNTPATRSSQVSQAINDRISRYLGYAVTDQSEVRQNARAIIAKAINAAESVPNVDSEEIKQLRQMATNPFNTNEDMLRITQNVKDRLKMALARAIGGFIPTGSSTAIPDTAQPSTVRGRPTVPSSTQPAPVQQQPAQRQQRTRGAAQPTSTIPPELDRQLTEAEAAARRGEVAPNTTVIPPSNTQSAPAQTSTPQPYSAEDQVKRAFERRKQQVR